MKLKYALMTGKINIQHLFTNSTKEIKRPCYLQSQRHLTKLNYTTKSRELCKKVKAFGFFQVPDDQKENASLQLNNNSKHL